jgi:hypothetical protein
VKLMRFSGKGNPKRICLNSGPDLKYELFK